MIGTRLKQYRVEATLGKGGMGEVYRAFDTRLQRPVALKILPGEYTADPDRRRRFLQEARAAGAVTHPAIAQIYDVDEVEGVTFMAMELVEGRTVTDLVAARELDVLAAIEVALQVAQGLARAHDAGIVHRDIKSDNIMVTPDGHAKLLDFGLAKLVEPETSGATGVDRADMETVARTQAGMVLGTISYMSPEQARAQPLDQRSDLFSLGVVLYHMAAGQLPFLGNSPVDTLHAIAYEETRPVTQIRPNLPASLQRVISRCLRKRPADRYADARQLAEALEGVRKEIESGISRGVPLSERLREGLASIREAGPRQWGLVAAGAAAAAVLIWFVFTRWDAPLVILVAFGGWTVYRRVVNRPRRMLRRFANKAGKLPEVRIVACRERQVTVVVDQVVARTYLRVNSLLEQVNARWFPGDKYTVQVRDDLAGEELRALLQGAGALYVRPDLLDQKL